MIKIKGNLKYPIKWKSDIFFSLIYKPVKIPEYKKKGTKNERIEK